MSVWLSLVSETILGAFRTYRTHPDFADVPGKRHRKWPGAGWNLIGTIPGAWCLPCCSMIHSITSVSLVVSSDAPVPPTSSFPQDDCIDVKLQSIRYTEGAVDFGRWLRYNLQRNASIKTIRCYQSPSIACRTPVATHVAVRTRLERGDAVSRRSEIN